jgi:hypothetical protein
MTKFTQLFIITIIISLFFGCSRSPRLSENEVIAIANNAAERAGHILSEYDKPRAKFNFVSKDSTWTVFYDGKIPAPGNHFMIWVKDQTGETQVMEGE